MRTLVLFVSISVGALYACGTSSDSNVGGDLFSSDGGSSGSGGNGSGSGNGSGTGSGNGNGTGSGSGTDGGSTSGGGTDAGNSGGGTDAGGGSVDAGSTCIDSTTANGSGHHNAGQDCLQCHYLNNTKGAPHWWAAGTLYDAVTGGNAVAGATIEIVDSAGTKQDLVTATNGNFWTATKVTFPATVRATACPDSVMMMQSDTSGACGKTGCHDSTMRIHLP
jgi:hypothetical protein